MAPVHNSTLKATTRASRLKVSKAKETEFKFRVASQADLDSVARTLGIPDTHRVHQENHFFDTSDTLLNRNKYVLRLRKEGSQYFLTAKGPSVRSTDGLLSAKPETERAIDTRRAKAILEGRRSALEVLSRTWLAPDERVVLGEIRKLLGSQSPGYIGSFSNERTRIEAPLSAQGQPLLVTLELDRTTFPRNVVHYEIEVEVPAHADAVALGEVLKDLFVKAKVKTEAGPGKATRFFAALKGQLQG